MIIVIIMDAPKQAARNIHHMSWASGLWQRVWRTRIAVRSFAMARVIVSIVWVRVQAEIQG